MTQKLTYTLRETENDGFILDANSSFPGAQGSLFAFTNASDLIRHLMKEYDVMPRSILGPEKGNPWHFIEEENAAFPKNLENHVIRVIWRGNGVETYPQNAETFASNWPLVAAFQIIEIGKPVVPPAPPAPPVQPAPGFPMQQPPTSRK